MAKPKNYVVISATVFALVALAHLLRSLAQWPIVIGAWSVPIEVSWFAAFVAAALSAWGWRLLFEQRRG